MHDLRAEHASPKTVHADLHIEVRRGLPMSAFLLGIFIWRITDEEELSRQVFGTEWEANYRRS